MGSTLRAIWFVFMACAAAFAQADFSADVVNLSAPTNTFRTKIFASKDKLRIQGEDKAGHTNSIMLVDLGKANSIVLMPQQKRYLENEATQIPGQGVTFFRAHDVEDACPDWKRVAQPDEAKAKCTKIGPVPVNGREALKYEITSPHGKSSFLWIDSKLHFPIKWQNAVASSELRNIREGPQPAELFKIPAGYTGKAYHHRSEPKTDVDPDK